MKIISPYIIELAPTLSGHWYRVWRKSVQADKGEYLGTFPSSTTVLNAYPQNPQLTQWIAEQGWHESQKIKSRAGEAGTRVHNAIERLLEGEEMDRDIFSLEEWYKLNTFSNWYIEYKPEILGLEIAIFSEKYRFAGRVDCVAYIRGELDVVDWKTSKNIYKHFPLQFGSYAQALEEMTDLKIENTAALQMGARNKDGFRFILYPDWREHAEIFRNVYETWKYDNGKNAMEAPVLELPQSLKLEL